MSKGEGLYPAPTRRVKDLDARLAEVQKGTKAAIPAMVPLHDIMRQKFHWYYKWSTWPASKFINILILVIYLGGAGFFAYNFLNTPKKAVADSAPYTYANDNGSGGAVTVATAATATSAKATYGTIEPASVPTGTAFATDANYTSISASDTDRYSTAGASNSPAYQQYRFYGDG